MAPTTVNVQNIALTTGDKEIKDFFSFCGKITDIKVTPSSKGDKTKDAVVVFEKETAARTAQLLNNTQLEGSQITVQLEDAGSDESESHPSSDPESDEISQEQKPRSRILAEYMASGYVIGDAALGKAIELDHKHGVSTRFVNTLTKLNQKYNATEKAKAADQSYGVTQRAGSLWNGLSSYFEKAANSPTGQKLVKFYTDGQRQVTDIHAEARRLADLKKESHGGSAVKAAGLERFLGKDQTTEPKAATGTAQPTQIKPTEAVPSKEPGSEKA